LSEVPGRNSGRRLLQAVIVHPRVPGFARRLAARIEASNLARRVAHGTFWSLGGTLSRALGLTASIVTARILGKEHFGELGVLTSTLMTFQVFASLGLGMTATKFVAELRWKDPARTARILALSTIVSFWSGVVAMGLLWTVAPWVAAHAIHAPELAGLLRIGALGLVFVTLGGAQAGALAGFEAFRTMARLNVMAGLFGVVAAVGGVWFWGLSGAVTAAVQWALTHFALRAHVLRYGIPTGLADWRREFRVLWTYSLPALGQGVMVIPVNWAAAAILVEQPFGYAEMGVLNAANQWYGAVLFLPSAISGAILPVLSERVGQGDAASARKVLRAAIAIDAAVVVPIIAAGSLASPWIMGMFGPGFNVAWPTLIAVLATAGLLAVANPPTVVLQASGRLWLGFAMSSVWAVTYIGVTLALVGWGSLGVALARLIAYLVNAIWTAWFAFRFLRVDRQAGWGRGSS
jgi:O-antigen/teichoic acid export membrane protein